MISFLSSFIRGNRMESKNVRVGAVMTAPRYEAVYARNFIEMALKETGIPITISGGVYYGQCMQIMLCDLVRQEVDFALTIDFDSMFTAAHIQRLLDIIAGDDSIDAIAAIQPKRGCGSVLASMRKETDVEWDGRPIQVDSAHFGLTLIRVAKLRHLPKPWFVSQPNADGDWSGDKIDDDVWFWRQWQIAGNTVYIDPGTRLGHLEEVVTVFDEQMKKVHHYPKDWSEIRASTVD